jgi:chromosome partitioning protein
VNATPPHGGRYDQAVEAIKKMGLAVCPASLGYRVAFEYAAQLGQSAAEYEPVGKAAEEIEALYTSIRRLVDTPTRQVKNTKEKVHEQAAQSR